ncbi:GGDEF domain-containing protein [Allorhizocola rhizosphaerae]|uniref:GGDEF domain-containing protein n=1 Tax=Allorhizocola rhizosphaerae TaxID=1872709 RepID=UPI0013C2B60A|nr:GGDEF domain-containing protein [Allorhizocola rhizosphaerae]
MIASPALAFLLGWLTARPLIRRLRAELADAAWLLSHDPLTGMLNRVGFHAALASSPQPVVVMLIDLDNFKPVNDTHGHDTGDDLLVETGDRITDTATMLGGTAARLSGDEFAVLLPVRDQNHSRTADLFLTTIAQPVQLTTGHTPFTVTVTASIGVTIAETADPLHDVALRRADIAMYHAKHAGGNRYTVYEPGMTMPANQQRRGPRLRDLRQQGRGVTA